MKESIPAQLLNWMGAPPSIPPVVATWRPTPSLTRAHDLAMPTPIAIPGTPFGAISLCSQPLKEIFDNNNEMLDLLAESYVTAAAQGRPGESLCDEIVARAVYLVRNVVRQGRFLEFLVSLCAVDGRGVRPIQWCVLPPNLPWWRPNVRPSKLAVVVRVCPAPLNRSPW